MWPKFEAFISEICGLLKSRDSLFNNPPLFSLCFLFCFSCNGSLKVCCVGLAFSYGLFFSVYFFPKITVHWLFTIVPFGLSFLYELIKGILEIEFFGCYFRWGGVIRVLKRGWELLRFPASPICFLSLYFCPFVCFFFFP